MKTAQIALAALVFAVAGAATAAPGENATIPTVTVTASTSANSGEAYQGNTNFVSTKTRAQVIQELYAARQNGEIFDGESYPGPFTTPAVKTRAQVVAELRDYRASHADQRDDAATTVDQLNA
jgi:hypothetical protein